MRKLKLFALSIVLLTMLPWICNSQATEAQYLPQTKFGLMVFDQPDTLKYKLEILDSLNIGMTRESQLTTTWKGYSSRLAYWQNHGIDVMLNINFLTQGKAPFPTGDALVDYLDAEDAILKAHKVEWVVIENEEQNAGYHTGNVTLDYATNQLTRAIDIAHANGVKITNGGLSTKPLRDLTYRHILKTDSAAANKFLLECIPERERTSLVSRNNKSLEYQLNETEWLLTYYSLIDLDAVNIHLYFPLINRVGKGYATTDTVPNQLAGLSEIVAYVQYVTRKPVISNEVGLVTKDYQLSYDVTAALAQSGMEWVCFWSGGKGAYHKESGKLSKNGKGVRDFINGK